MNKHVTLTIHVESTGNASIRNTMGETVAVIEGWTLYVGGERVADVSSYHEAIHTTQNILENKNKA